MAMGMEMMLKSMGLDPKDLVSKFEMLQNYVAKVDASLTKLAESQQTIINQQKQLIELLKESSEE